jgi:hypothetical protein
LSDLISDPEKYRKGWHGGLPETECGYGSTMDATKKQRAWIPEVIEAYGIMSIADIGAGDLNWIKDMNLPSYVQYWPYDLVPRFDLIKEVPDSVDLIMCLWVLNHLPYEECKQAISNIKKSGSRFLMITDRIRYREDQPTELTMPYIEKMSLNHLGDSIRLIDLEAI